MQPRIMYIEDKSSGLPGPARVGCVSFSRSGSSLYNQGRTFRSLNGRGLKSNYADIDSGARFRISGCRKDGADRLYGERVPVEIDDDARVEYWTVIRGLPERSGDRIT